MLFINPPPPPLPTEGKTEDIIWPDTRNMPKPTAERPLYVDEKGILYRKINLGMFPGIKVHIASEEEIFKGQYWGVLPDPKEIPSEERYAPYLFGHWPSDFLRRDLYKKLKNE